MWLVCDTEYGSGTGFEGLLTSGQTPATPPTQVFLETLSKRNIFPPRQKYHGIPRGGSKYLNHVPPTLSYLYHSKNP